MRPDGDDLAVVVQAYQFDLLDPLGLIAASLANGTDVSNFPLQGLYAGLEMKHNDALTTDSALRWTDAQGVAGGNEYLGLFGPAAAGAAAGNRPRLQIARTAVNNHTDLLLSAGRGDGAADGLTPSLELANSNGTNPFMQLICGQHSMSMTTGSGLQINSGGGGMNIAASFGAQMDIQTVSGGNMLLTSTAGLFLRTSGTQIQMDTSGVDINGSIAFYPANPQIIAFSYITFPGGIYCNGASGSLAYFDARIMARNAIANDSGVQVTITGARNTGNFATQNLNITSPSGNETGLTMWNQAGAIAPIMRVFQSFGERFDFVNSPNSAYVSLNASAFTVQSSERVKIDVAAVDDARLLDLVGSVRTHRFRNKVRPVTIRPTERFASAAARWAARGRKPLELTPRHTYPADHDCAVDDCAGTAADPCPITRNDTHRLGLIAEHVHQHAPEMTDLDELAAPAALAVDQVASVAFGAVGALLRYVQALEARVSQLETAQAR